MKSKPISLYAALAAAAAALALGACQKREGETVGQAVDGAIARSEQKASEAQDAVKEQTEQAKEAGQRMADQATRKLEGTADKAGSAVEDAAVTASVNAELAKDPKLSALKIDVDTANGRVLLTGKAPDEESRDRATRLASNVKGVQSVENRLTVGG